MASTSSAGKSDAADAGFLKISEYVLEPLRKDDEFILYRGHARSQPHVNQPSVLLLRPVSARPAPVSLQRLEHEYALRAELDPAWAVRSLAVLHHNTQTMLVLEDPGGEPLARLIRGPMDMTQFLRFAVELASALGRLHWRGLVHKDVKPSNVLVDAATGQVRLMGFGIASRLSRERQSPEPPEFIAGTLPYMAPEQTGRMNRSIDSRSDLYALGVTLYEMLTGGLPFTASDPIEWVHCHIARQPTPPADRAAVPEPLSSLIVKLLAKNAEERYQTAAGVENDLRRCLADWQHQHRIDDFPLGQHDIPYRLLIPEKLYGRAREVEALLAAFDRIVKSGAPELVVVSGYSGIGKSSVVNELHKSLVPPRGLFASGKFDQYKRDIPYSTLVQAFQSLVRPLLGKSDTELAIWRNAFLEALEPNARLMTDLIPELTLIIGEPPPVPELEPQQAQRRFQLVFRRFIGVFARADHPLALFLDDLQWLDVATLDLLEDLLTQSDLQHLMLIGAYRDNEVNATHPLMVKLRAIRNTGGKVEEITLAPLAREHIENLIADALHCERERAAPLAQLVHEKTADNPFFVIQFLHALAEEDLLVFDHDAACWRWDLDRIRAQGYTENVVDLMVGKVTRLPAETQQALQQLACLGNAAAIAMLSIVLGTSGKQAHAALWPAVHHELVERLESHYRFIHDRVQEAAYSLIPEASRAEVHLRIGRLLAAQTPPEKREEAIFEIVNQLNRGAALITSRDEREQLAEFNLLAGQRAKASAAYASALTYLNAGAALLSEDSWQRRHELAFVLELNRAECEFLTGQLFLADELLAALSKRATRTVDQALVACLQMDVCTTLDQSGRAVAICLDRLRHVGIDWSPHPQDEEVRREYERIGSLLGGRSIEDLIDLPLMEDPASLATVEVLSRLYPPALFTDANLTSLMICKAVQLSLERGNCDASCITYILLATIAGPRFGDYQAGFRFGQLGYDLVERRGLKRFEARACLSFASFVVRWMKHVRDCRDLLRRAFDAADQSGDLTYAAYTCDILNSDLLFAGEPLTEVQGEAEHGLGYAQKARFGLVIDFITTQLALIRMLRGLTPKFGCLDDGQFNELNIEQHLSSNPALAMAACWYWIRKLQARYVAGDYATALDAASKAQRLLWTATAFYEEAEYHFYGALTRAAWCDSAPADERPQLLEAVAAHHRQLQAWAENCPESFGNRAALVGAEIARIEGRVVDAEQLYKQAIHLAQENGFVHNEALANERASTFYRARGFDQIADLYLRNARYSYLRWGADGKVRQLDELYPQLSKQEPVPDSRLTIGTPIEHLDLATILRVSQAVSGQIVLEKLIDILLRTVLEHSGAERGLLILPQGAELRVQAEAKIQDGSVTIVLGDMRILGAELPVPIVQYAARTQESVILEDASASGSFSNDEYIRREHVRSILCLPVVRQGRLIAVLYLENNLAANAFNPARIAVLNVIASAAANSLENSRLYRELQERVEEIKHLKDRLHDENLALREQIDQVFMFEEIVGSSPALQTVVSSIVQVAPTDSTVLITGETGTGKELIARAIHKRSQRAGQAFISVNCASIPSSLIASELFGHEKGAFTGALQRRQGRFELAHSGTIFLDEIGELPAETQIALLRVIQEREFERVGGNRIIPTDVRVIAATNRDLKAAIASGTFRADLFYRLNVFPIEAPPLRQRKEDIPPLVEYFVKRYAEKAGKQISKIDKNALALCQSYDWPGNVRELQNIIERSVILCSGDTFSVDEAWLPGQEQLRPAPSDAALRESSPASPKSANRALNDVLEETERHKILEALKECTWVVAGPKGAAAYLGMKRSTLEQRIRKLGIARRSS
jgi:predicted ATPase/transcriptional regulator with GAF, ATPase, and Fis domain